MPDLLITVMFGDHPVGPPTHDELFAFSGRSGKVLWSHRVTDVLTFGAGRFGPPWIGIQPALAQAPFKATTVASFRVDGQVRIAWLQGHITWWPSILTVLDRFGSPLSKWVHSGMIYTLATTNGGEPGHLLVGGISNSREAAFFAVLDARDVDGAGPEERSSPFECRSCGMGRPQRYFVIDPSELMLAVNRLQPCSGHSGLCPWRRGRHRRELGSPSESFHVRGIALFSPTFELEQVAWSSGWDNRHRELERQGKLDHALEQCRERGKPPRVREWTPEGGWRKVVPRAIAPGPGSSQP